MSMCPHCFGAWPSILFFGICHIMRIDDVTCHVPWGANGLRQGSQPGAWVGGFICLLPATEILFVASFRLRWLKCPCRPGRHGPQFWGHSMTPDLGQTRMTRAVRFRNNFHIEKLISYTTYFRKENTNLSVKKCL